VSEQHSAGSGWTTRLTQPAPAMVNNPLLFADRSILALIGIARTIVSLLACAEGW